MRASKFHQDRDTLRFLAHGLTNHRYSRRPSEYREPRIMALLSGAFIHVRLHVADHPDTLLVPQVAVGSSQLGEYVYVAENGKAVQRMVTTSAPNGDLVIVTHGVKAGEQVIVGNLQKIRPDAPVQPTSWR